MAKNTKDNQAPSDVNATVQNSAEENKPQEETLEQKVVRLEAEKNEALKEKQDALEGQKAAIELATQSSIKLQKLEGVKTESTVDIGDETYKVLLKKFALQTKGSPIAKKFHLVKDADGNVDEDHHYPTEEEFSEIADKEGILEKL